MDDADYANQRRMAIAQALMQQAPAQGNYGGMANAGSTLAGALAMKGLQNRQAQQAYDKAAPVTANLSLPGVNGPMQSTLSAKSPYIGPKGLSGLFNFGGDS